MSQRARFTPTFTIAGVVWLATAAAFGCFTQRHVVGDGVVTDADAGATDSSDAASDGIVVSLGDKTSLGWALAIPPEEIARRLSVFMLQRPPTPGLTAAVVARAPKTNQDVGELADGLLLDGNSEIGRRAFYRWWLRLDDFQSASRSATFPTFTSTAAQLLVEQTLAFTEDVTWQPAGSLGTLLTQPAAFISTETAGWFPGVSAPTGPAATKVMLDATRYAGILTQPAVAATHDGPAIIRPTIRGRDARRRFLCGSLWPEDNGLCPVRPWTTIDRAGTTRDSISNFRPCEDCHHSSDSLGYAFNHFDAIGAYQETDLGLSIGTMGQFKPTLVGGSVPFAGVTELAQVLAKLPEVTACYAHQWLTYAVGTFRAGPDGISANDNYSKSVTLQNDIDFVVKRATVQGQLNLRGVIRAVTETHAFLDPWDCPHPVGDYQVQSFAACATTPFVCPNDKGAFADSCGCGCTTLFNPPQEGEPRRPNATIGPGTPAECNGPAGQFAQFETPSSKVLIADDAVYAWANDGSTDPRTHRWRVDKKTGGLTVVFDYLSEPVKTSAESVMSSVAGRYEAGGYLYARSAGVLTRTSIGGGAPETLFPFPDEGAFIVIGSDFYQGTHQGELWHASLVPPVLAPIVIEQRGGYDDDDYGSFVGADADAVYWQAGADPNTFTSDGESLALFRKCR